MHILGLIISFGLILLAGWSTGGLNTIIDMPSAVMVGGLTLGGLLLTGSPVALMLRSIFSGSLTVEERRSASTGWKRAQTYALAGGFIGSLVGFAALGHHISLPDQVDVLAPALATTSITILYALILGYFICLPMHVSLKDREPG